MDQSNRSPCCNYLEPRILSPNFALSGKIGHVPNGIFMRSPNVGNASVIDPSLTQLPRALVVPLILTGTIGPRSQGRTWGARRMASNRFSWNPLSAQHLPHRAQCCRNFRLSAQADFDTHSTRTASFKPRGSRVTVRLAGANIFAHALPLRHYATESLVESSEPPSQ